MTPPTGQAVVQMGLGDWSSVCYALARFEFTEQEESKLPRERAAWLLRRIDAQVEEQARAQGAIHPSRLRGVAVTSPRQTDSVELVRELVPYREGQIREVWRVPCGLVEISTVPHTRSEHDWDGLLGAVAGFLGPGNPDAEYFQNRCPDQEETMAFPCDDRGERVDSIQIVAAQGPGSRERVMEMLAAGTSWR